MKKILLAIVLSVVVSGAAYAANQNNPIDGTIKAIYGDVITLSVPSTVDKSSDVKQLPAGYMDIKTNAETVYDNFNRLTDLKQGDSVEISYDYDTRGKNKVAKRVTRTEPADGAATSVTTTKTTVTTTTVDVDHVPTTNY